MTLDEILDQWDIDAKIDETNIGHEASRNPQLHAKYIRLLATSKLQLRSSESRYLTARKIHFRYFNGELNRAELVELGWEQYQGIKPLKTQMEDMLLCAPELIKLTDKMEYFTTVKTTLESILKEISNRVWTVKTSFEYQKMMNGN